MRVAKQPVWTKFLTGSKNYIQFSKRIAIAVTIFWMVYRIVNFVVILIRPEASQTLVDLVQGVDTAMIANMGWYTGNSTVEKAVLAFSSKTKDEDKDGTDKDDKDDNG